MVASLNRGITIQTPKYYNPYYGTPKRVPLILGHPCVGRRRYYRTSASLPYEKLCPHVVCLLALTSPYLTPHSSALSANSGWVLSWGSRDEGLCKSYAEDMRRLFTDSLSVFQ